MAVEESAAPPDEDQERSGPTHYVPLIDPDEYRPGTAGTLAERRRRVSEVLWLRRAFGRAVWIAARTRHVVRALNSYALLIVGPRPPRLRRLWVVRTLHRRVINDISV
jgi:hypothetical protein